VKAFELAVELAQQGKLTWTAEVVPDPGGGDGAQAYRGATEGGDLTALVVAFDIESQGFPAGSLGYDGTLTLTGNRPSFGGPLVLRLPREVAEQLHKLAQEATPERS
jgi:hypothetical protein